MRLLLDNRWAPVTTGVGFIETDPQTAAKFFLDWRRRITGGTRPIKAHEVPGPLEAALARLLPLVSVVHTRWLFVPTQSRWTAYFDNGWRGTDAFGAMSYMAKELKCRGIQRVFGAATRGLALLPCNQPPRKNRRPRLVGLKHASVKVPGFNIQRLEDDRHQEASDE
jgi:hypothetical protein